MQIEQVIVVAQESSEVTQMSASVRKTSSQLVSVFWAIDPLSDQKLKCLLRKGGYCDIHGLCFVGAKGTREPRQFDSSVMALRATEVMKGGLEGSPG
ncbi:hypothetical protein ASC58_12155 [Phycicoccus sp. Root101]|nr:hypothetical protein ASC58_12155 [Phycicoccus sp. Root101]